MNAPFVLVEGLDVSLHASIGQLIGFVEAQDVRDGVFEVFDARGRIVLLTAASDRGPVLAEPGDTAVGRLRELLIAYLAAIGREPVGVQVADATTLDLNSLIELVARSQTRGPSPAGDIPGR